VIEDILTPEEQALARHRGPFRFQVCRERTPKGKQYPATFETLPGTVSREDVTSEATALLDDPRDTIVRVFVWSESEQQHIITFCRKSAA
jgi:hypothetical protein